MPPLRSYRGRDIRGTGGLQPTDTHNSEAQKGKEERGSGGEMTTIYVRKGPYERDGKFGKQYLILGTDGIYYEQSKPFEKGIEEGATLEIEGKLSSNSKYFKLKSLKIVEQGGARRLQANPSVGETQTSKTEAKQGIPNSNPVLPALTPLLQSEWIKKADEALALAGADKDIEAGIEIELIRQYFSCWMADRIDQGKENRIQEVKKLKEQGK